MQTNKTDSFWFFATTMSELLSSNHRINVEHNIIWNLYCNMKKFKIYFLDNLVLMR